MILDCVECNQGSSYFAAISFNHLSRCSDTYTQMRAQAHWQILLCWYLFVMIDAILLCKLHTISILFSIWHRLNVERWMNEWQPYRAVSDMKLGSGEPVLVVACVKCQYEWMGRRAMWSCGAAFMLLLPSIATAVGRDMLCCCCSSLTFSHACCDSHRRRWSRESWKNATTDLTEWIVSCK